MKSQGVIRIPFAYYLRYKGDSVGHFIEASLTTHINA